MCQKVGDPCLTSETSTEDDICRNGPAQALSALPVNQKREGSVHRYGMWQNRYGKVLAEFTSVQTSEHGTVGKGCPQSSVAAKIAIQSNVGASGSFRIALDLNPQLNPSAMITYQATLPNNSSVFKIAAWGNPEDLLKALEGDTKTDCELD